MNSVGWHVREGLVMERRAAMSLQRWFYAGGRPNRVARLLDRLTAAISARGLGPDYLVVLEVPGRRSGRKVGLPLVVAAVKGERYLVSIARGGSELGAKCEGGGGRRRPAPRTSRGGAAGGSSAGPSRARTEGIPEAGAERQSAHADR